MKAIKLGEISWHLLFPSLAIAFSFGEKAIKLHPRWKPHFLIYQLYIYFLMAIIGGLMEFFYVKKGKSKGMQMLLQKDNDNDQSDKTDSKVKVLFSVLILGVISLVYAVNQFLLNLFYDYSYLNDSSKIGLMIFQVVSAALLSRWIFKEAHSIQHYIALIIAISCYAIIVAVSITQLFNQWIFIVVAFVFYQAQIAIGICEKYLIDKRYFTPFKLILIKAISALCAVIAIVAITQSTPCANHLEDYFSCERDKPIESFEMILGLFNQRSGLEVLLFVAFILISAMYHFTAVLTNYCYSTSHMAVVDIIAYFPFILLRLNNGDTDEQMLSLGFAYVVLLSACGVYTEAVILGFVLFSNEEWKDFKSEDLLINRVDTK